MLPLALKTVKIFVSCAKSRQIFACGTKKRQTFSPTREILLRICFRAKNSAYFLVYSWQFGKVKTLCMGD